MLVWKQVLTDINVRSLSSSHIFCQYGFCGILWSYISMKFVLVESNSVGFSSKFKFKISQHLTLHLQSELCITCFTRRKGKGNKIICAHLITVRGWKKWVTTYWLLTQVFNKAIKISVCVLFLCSWNTLFFNMGVQLHFSLPASSTKCGVYYYRLAYMRYSQASLTAYN